MGIHSKSWTLVARVSTAVITFPYLTWKGSIIVTKFLSLIGFANTKPPSKKIKDIFTNTSFSELINPVCQGLRKQQVLPMKRDAEYPDPITIAFISPKDGVYTNSTVPTMKPPPSHVAKTEEHRAGCYK